jgi:hypothetical protein
MKNILRAVALLAAASLPAVAHATIVNINGAVTGCDSGSCSGGHPGPGYTIGSFINPVIVTFGPGTYTVTNGVGQAGALYDAWNFNTGSDNNWIWSFIIAGATTKKVILDNLTTTPTAFVGSHSAVANSAYALDYSDTFTLTQTTDLAFVTEDYYPPDNAGGVSLNITLQGDTGAVPEPASWALMMCGLGLAGGALRARGSKRALRLA